MSSSRPQPKPVKSAPLEILRLGKRRPRGDSTFGKPVANGPSGSLAYPMAHFAGHLEAQTLGDHTALPALGRELEPASPLRLVRSTSL